MPPWWRAKLDFGSGEPLDDLHRSTAFRTGVKVGGVFGGGSVFFVRRLLCRTQQRKAKREELGASSAGQKAEVPRLTHWKQKVGPVGFEPTTNGL